MFTIAYRPDVTENRTPVKQISRPAGPPVISSTKVIATIAVGKAGQKRKKRTISIKLARTPIITGIGHSHIKQYTL